MEAGANKKIFREKEMCFLTSSIGSLPHTDAEAACNLVFEKTSEMPAWPQLPRRSFHENMCAQFSEGLPGIMVDSDSERVWFDSEKLSCELEEFYADLLDEKTSRFRISNVYASGFEMFVSKEFAEARSNCSYLKGQVTGPVTFGLKVTREDGKASFYDETLRQVITNSLKFKSKWQVEQLRKSSPRAEIVIFFDEPYLVSAGSGLLAVDPELIKKELSFCMNDNGADLTGVHVCGNTDWSLVLSTGLDIINFDAFNYMEEFLAYMEDIGEFLESGGIDR
ncbi:MAG: hypothetical protein PHP64_07885, partial [Actinomycetota bacterium]|nr:hypothetical protein [Actinomycetota bacterium]